MCETPALVIATVVTEASAVVPDKPGSEGAAPPGKEALRPSARPAKAAGQTNAILVERFLLIGEPPRLGAVVNIATAPTVVLFRVRRRGAITDAVGSAAGVGRVQAAPIITRTRVRLLHLPAILTSRVAT